jgi:polar amino acid transport system substrate-binding protein
MNRRALIWAGLGTVSFALGVTIAGCYDPTASTTGTSGQKKLTMVTSPDYPPYEFYETGTRTIVGFDVDIAKRITSELGYELEIKESDFNGLVPALQAKRADFVMAGMTPTPERRQNVDFSQIYYEAKDTIVALKGSNLTTTASLAGKTVGVQLGSIQEGNAKKIAEKVKGVTIKQLNRVPDIVQEIKARRIDAGIIENTVAAGFTQANPELAFTVIPSAGESGSAIAFPKGSPLVAEFDRVLTKLKAEGEIAKLADKWFQTSVPASPAAAPTATVTPAATPTASP